MTLTETSMPALHVGNAHDAGATRGWLVGSFIAPEHGPRHTSGVEVKWGVHRAGEERPAWTEFEPRATIAILVSGRFTIRTSAGDVTLSRSGDYVSWGPGVTHWWRADQDSTLVTARWVQDAPGRKPCRRWAPWRCDLQPTSIGGWILRCVYCGRKDYPGS